MESVITLIGDQIPFCLNDIQGELKRRNLQLGETIWLKENHALDLSYSGPTPAIVNSWIKALLAPFRIDVYAQHLSNRRKRLLICDMDSTIITSETMDDIAAASPWQEKILAVTQQSIRGEIDFAEGLRRRVDMIQGMDSTIFEQVRLAMAFSKGADILIQTMRTHGAFTALVSGGFTYFAEDVGSRLGFNRTYANHLPLSENRVSGPVTEPILDSVAKSTILLDIARELDINAKDSAAIGDGSNDIAMLKTAGLGCAYRGKPIVKEAISCQLNFSDLTGLLYYQGYRWDEFHPAP